MRREWRQTGAGGALVSGNRAMAETSDQPIEARPFPKNASVIYAMIGAGVST